MVSSKKIVVRVRQLAAPRCRICVPMSLEASEEWRRMGSLSRICACWQCTPVSCASERPHSKLRRTRLCRMGGSAAGNGGGGACAAPPWRAGPVANRTLLVSATRDGQLMYEISHHLCVPPCTIHDFQGACRQRTTKNQTQILYHKLHGDGRIRRRTPSLPRE